MSEPYKLDPSIKKHVTKDNTIHIKHLTAIKMGCKQCIVVHNGVVKQWIGIGWVDKKQKADQLDYTMYPKVVED